MMAVFRHVMEFLVNPFFICLFLLGACLLISWRRLSPVWVRTVISGIFIILLVMSTGWLPRYMTYTLESKYPVVSQPDPAIKWVVVLSGGQNDVKGMPANNLLTSVTIKRLIEGVRLFRELPRAMLVLSGGGIGGDQKEASLLAQVVEWFAIPKNRIMLEINSINTADQARELVAIVHKEPFYLVTSAAHMSRSMALCQREGLHPIAAPTDYTFYWSTDTWEKLLIPNTYNLSYFSIAMHEVLGTIWAFRLKGH